MTSSYLQELTPGAYAHVQPDGGWWVSNAGVIGTSDGAVFVDTTATESRTHRMLHRVTDQLGASATPRACVLTHAHGDHAGGVGLLGGVRVYAAKDTADDLSAHGLNFWPTLFPDIEWGAVRVVPIDVLVTGPTSVLESDQQPTLILPATSPAHSPSDAVVWLPESRVLFAGDLVWSQVTPLCVFGSITGWHDELLRLQQLDPVLVVPGHGPVSPPSAISETVDYLENLQVVAAEATARGWSPAEAIERRPLESCRWLEVQRDVVNLHQAMAEAAGTELDAAAAMNDLVAAYGGRIPTHV